MKTQKDLDHPPVSLLWINLGQYGVVGNRPQQSTRNSHVQQYAKRKTVEQLKRREFGARRYPLEWRRKSCSICGPERAPKDSQGDLCRCNTSTPVSLSTNATQKPAANVPSAANKIYSRPSNFPPIWQKYPDIVQYCRRSTRFGTRIDHVLR
jgi:hypothetical protein